MTTLLAFPLRLTGTGSFAAHDNGTVDYLAEELAQLVGTIPGERILVPTYGMEDPTFDQFNQAALLVQIETFGPPVKIQAVVTGVIDDTSSHITITFDVANGDTVDDDYGA